MDNRKYNIYFNTHTVSGIIICAILYVMFFAGSFTFFKDDIAAWQKNDSQLAHTAPVKKDFNYLIDSLGKKHKLKGRDFDFTMQRNHQGVYVSMSASHDSTIKKQKGKGGRFGGRGGRGGRGEGESEGGQEARRGGRPEGSGEGSGAMIASNDTAGKRQRFAGRGQGRPEGRRESRETMTASNDTAGRKPWGRGRGQGRSEGRHEGHESMTASNDTTGERPRFRGHREGRTHGHGAPTASNDTAGRKPWARDRSEGRQGGRREGNTPVIASKATRVNKGRTGGRHEAKAEGGYNANQDARLENKQDTAQLAKADVGNGDKKEGEKDGKKERRGRGRRGDGDSAFFTYDFSKHKEADYTSGYTMGEFLYRLHFLAQVNQILPFRIGVPFGYLLAGIVSFIFLFALITGLLLHWDKLVSNFFTFRPWNKWKNVWTELHTVLGVIGFPYQLVFAVTGIILIFNSFLIIPYTNLFYKGKQEKIYKDLGYGIKSEFAYTYHPLQKKANVDSLVAVVEKKWQRSELNAVAIRNYGDSNMHVIVTGKPQTAAQMNGQGEWIYRVRDNKVISDRPPLTDNSYLSTFKGMIYHLHFGDYGGRPLKVIYFVLGILGCIVINSGVMIWLVARDKNNIPERKRKFNFWTANVYLSSSLSLLPVTGLTMIVLLFLKQPEQSDIYHWFFYSWLILSVYLLVRRNLDIVNKHTTLLSAVVCILLPILDGIKRGNWFWLTYKSGAFDILFIDVLFLVLGIISVAIYWKMSQKKEKPAAAAPAPRRKAAQPAVVEA